jgi:hypothetical protein
MTKAYDEFIAGRIAAGLLIDPANAEVMYDYGVCGDPYEIIDLADREGWCAGRRYFARALPDGDWVSFHDLPDATRDALEEKRRRIAWPVMWQTEAS